jgi:hypothetical protein
MARTRTKSVVRAAKRESLKVEAATADTTPTKTHDAFVNFQARLGQGTDNQSSYGSYAFHPITRNRMQLDLAYRGSWICRMAVKAIAEDMTREGIGDGTTDDTTIVQDAVDDAEAAGGGTVFFSMTSGGGRYLLTHVVVPPTVTIEFAAGVVAVRPDLQPNGTRMFETSDWTAASDSPPITFRNVTCDGNRDNQGPYTAYQLEQSHLICLSAPGSTGGRLTVIMDNVEVTSVVADGIAVKENINLQATNIRGSTCFRGVVDIQGGNSDVQITNVKGSGDPTYSLSGFHVELDTPGYGGSLASTIKVTNLQMDGPLSVAVGAGSEFIGTNVKAGPSCTFQGHGKISITGGTLTFGYSDSFVNRIVNATDCTFNNVGLVISRAGAPGAPQSFYAGHIYYHVGETTTGSRIRFSDCHIKTDGTILGGDTCMGIYNEADATSHDNRIIVEGGSIGSDVPTGMGMAQGGIWRVRGLRMDSPTAFRLSNSVGYNFDVELDSISLGSTVTTYMNSVSSGVDCALKQSNITHTATQKRTLHHIWSREHRVYGTPDDPGHHRTYDHDAWLCQRHLSVDESRRRWRAGLSLPEHRNVRRRVVTAE